MQQMFRAMRETVPAGGVFGAGCGAAVSTGKVDEQAADVAASGVPSMNSAAARDAIAEDTALLVETLETECRLLAELTSILKQQREGVATDNMNMVDDSVFGAHRVMGTLKEAQRRRHSLVELLTGTQMTSLAELDDALGPIPGHALADVRGRIGREARALAREIRINRSVLEGALDQGDRLVMALCDATARRPVPGR